MSLYMKSKFSQTISGFLFIGKIHLIILKYYLRLTVGKGRLAGYKSTLIITQKGRKIWRQLYFNIAFYR